jgi:hypothetical protein
VLGQLAAMAPLFVSARHQGPVDFSARGGFGKLSGVHFFVIVTGTCDFGSNLIRAACDSQISSELFSTMGNSKRMLRISELLHLGPAIRFQIRHKTRENSRQKRYLGGRP